LKPSEIYKQLVLEGFAADFQQGMQAPVFSKDTSRRSSPFDMINNNEGKKILDAVINGRPLDQNQLQKLKTIYSKL
jgi:hypothetical protein